MEFLNRSNDTLGDRAGEGNLPKPSMRQLLFDADLSHPIAFHFPSIDLLAIQLLICWLLASPLSALQENYCERRE